MLRILKEYDDDYEREYEREYDYDYDYRGDAESYRYEEAYCTYYKDSNEMRVPIENVVLTNTNTTEVDYSVADMAVENVKRDIDADVRKGNYPGLWVHYISLDVLSDEKQRDVDYWSGSTYADEDSIDVNSVEIPLPEDWEEDDTDYAYLAEYVYEAAANREGL